MAVPPLDEMACTAPAIVSRSPVGPVIAPSDFAKGATMMRSFGRRKSASRPGGRAHELHSGVHALARVHEQRVGHRQRFDARKVDRLRLVVLEHAERGGVQAADESIGLVHHRRFEQHSRDARGLDDLERRELDRIRHDVAERVARVDANAGRLERVGVGPLDGVRRTFPVVADQRVVHVEPDRSERNLRRVGDLRDDPDGARQPEAAERRRDAHRQRRFSARRPRGGSLDPARALSPASAAPLRRGRRRASARDRRIGADRRPLTRTPAQAPRLPRSSWRTRPRGARGSAVAARRGTRPATAPDRSGRGDDSRAARFRGVGRSPSSSRSTRPRRRRARRVSAAARRRSSRNSSTVGLSASTLY